MPEHMSFPTHGPVRPKRPEKAVRNMPLSLRVARGLADEQRPTKGRVRRANGSSGRYVIHTRKVTTS